MRYCVIKNTATIIDGSLNNTDVMLRNAVNAGFTEGQVEILTPEQFYDRKALEPPPPPQPSQDEILKAKIETETINLLIDLGVI